MINFLAARQSSIFFLGPGRTCTPSVWFMVYSILRARTHRSKLKALNAGLHFNNRGESAIFVQYSFFLWRRCRVPRELEGGDILGEGDGLRGYRAL